MKTLGLFLIFWVYFVAWTVALYAFGTGVGYLAVTFLPDYAVIPTLILLFFSAVLAGVCVLLVADNGERDE